MKRYILILVTVLFFQEGMAQKDSVKKVLKEKQVCFNMTPFAAQFIPFNAINPFTTGPVNIAAKVFVNNIGYRFGVGVNIDGDNTNQNLHLNIRNGYEIRKNISGKWNYSHGCDAVLSFGNLNLPGNTTDNSEILIGLAPFWGVEYNFGKYLSLSTETSLLIGIASDGFFNGNPLRLKFIPPIALYLNLKR